MESVLDLKAIQLDALKEIANIGAGNAATALSQMTGQPIEISVPELFGVENAQLSQRLFEGVDEVAVATVSILGDLGGYSALVLPVGDVGAMCARLMATTEPAIEDGALTPMAASILQEVENVIAGSYLNALASFIDMSLLPSVPAVRIVSIDDAVKALGEDAASIVICAATEFQFEAQGDEAVLRSQFLHLPDETSLQTILKAINLA